MLANILRAESGAGEIVVKILPKPYFHALYTSSNCIHSWLPRCSRARGSTSGLSLGVPTKVKALLLFTEGSLKVKK